MKDYSNYIVSPTSKILAGATRVYDNELLLEGVDVLVDNLEINEKVIVRNHGSLTNEFKEERYLIFRKSLNIHRGSLITYLNQNYIVLTDIDEENLVYNTCAMQKCNNTLTFQLPDLSIYTIPCIYENYISSASNGTSSTNFFNVGDDVVKITISNNDITSKLELDSRYIFKHNKNDIYQLVHIDDVTNEGILYLTMNKSTLKDSDRLDLNIADYIEYIAPSDTGYSVLISGDSTIVASGYEYQYTANIYNDSIEIFDKTVVFSLVGGADLVSIESQDGTTCTLLTNSEFNTGNVILRAELSDDSTVYYDFSINIGLF